MREKLLYKKLVKGIRRFFAKAGKKKAVIGLSGGIDSALCACLFVQALGKKNVFALLMPLKGISSKKNLLDAKKYAKKLGVRHFIIPIELFALPFLGLPWKRSNSASSNLFARLRAVILYDFANSSNAMVCGTGNKSELLLGYFTKYGDAAADFFPIGDLYKTDVRGIAKFLGIPKEFLEKAPTAELWVGQTDEGEIGAKYAEIDQILKLFVEKGKSRSKLLGFGFSRKKVERIMALHRQSRHKRELPPIIKTGKKQYT
ncbi:MAG: NAD+ synthase [Candidatus Diapherotrites archaeon]|nr:NAD+ synthase [Candidatus Diapherotrites archaeon]